eukprot:TRINITY_DN13530_c0_g1_i1.p1 TRINITY_DN13530_c0_g1~~TRINITY_DN13530_c0_g1_i1.p1  ORF type:complete len:167 (+),score=28.64 TRINITY_DN13530_c0_g1_i1:72-572(+)
MSSFGVASARASKAIHTLASNHLPGIMASLVGEKRAEWNACLRSSCGAPSRCEKIEKELQLLSKNEGIDSCIAETVALIKCTSSSSRQQGCSTAFLAMRECNRAGGKHLISEGDGYAIAPGKVQQFNAADACLVASAMPTRTLEGMRAFGEAYAQSLGISCGQIMF